MRRETCANCGEEYSHHMHTTQCYPDSDDKWFPKALADAIQKQRGLSPEAENPAPAGQTGFNCDEAEAIRAWRECGLPEWFLGNGNTNAKLVAFAKQAFGPNCEHWEYQQRIDSAQERIRVLAETLQNLANEASGFRSMADPFTHGHTNIAVLGLRIDEARALLADAALNPNQPEEPQ